MKNAPSRDTIILWSAVIAGTGLLALLVRHAAIYKFGNFRPRMLPILCTSRLAQAPMSRI